MVVPGDEQLPFGFSEEKLVGGDGDVGGEDFSDFLDFVDMVAGSHVFQVLEHFGDAHGRDDDEVDLAVVGDGVLGLADAAAVVLADGRDDHEDLAFVVETVVGRDLDGRGLVREKRLQQGEHVGVEA